MALMTHKSEYLDARKALLLSQAARVLESLDHISENIKGGPFESTRRVLRDHEPAIDAQVVIKLATETMDTYIRLSSVDGPLRKESIDGLAPRLTKLQKTIDKMEKFLAKNLIPAIDEDIHAASLQAQRADDHAQIDRLGRQHSYLHFNEVGNAQRSLMMLSAVTAAMVEGLQQLPAAPARDAKTTDVSQGPGSAASR